MKSSAILFTVFVLLLAGSLVAMEKTRFTVDGSFGTAAIGGMVGVQTDVGQRYFVGGKLGCELYRNWYGGLQGGIRIPEVSRFFDTSEQFRLTTSLSYRWHDKHWGLNVGPTVLAKNFLAVSALFGTDIQVEVGLRF